MYIRLASSIGQVVDWILGPAEKLMTSQSDIGDSYATAEELRKQHEQLELKCTVRGVMEGANYVTYMYM